MGTEIVVDVVPQRIDPSAWAEAYDETLSLLAKHPARLVGCELRMAAGVPVHVYTRSIECVTAAGEERARRWCVAGAMGSFGAGDPQSMYRDLAMYLGPCPSPGPEDLLLHAAEDAGSTRFGPGPRWVREGAFGAPALAQGGGIVRVLGGRAPGPACQLPLLAAAMVIEGRFPRHAMVHGDIDRELAETARRWASSVLGRPVALPVRVDAWRLVERLSARPSSGTPDRVPQPFEGEALVRAVDRLYLAEASKKDGALFGIFGRAEAEPWWLTRLRAHPHPDTPGAKRLLAAYLDATHDPARMCGLACLDARGPRYAPDDLAEVLGALEERPDDTAVAEAFATVFGAGAPRLVSMFSTCAERERSGIDRSAGIDGGSTEDEIEALAGLSSAADLSPTQRDHIHALAFLARERPAIPEPPATLRRNIASSLARGGPVLTEDAWAWIEREEDTDVLGLLAAIGALDRRDPDLARVRRALFESRALAGYAVSALRDGAIMAAVAERMAAEVAAS
jgi:hypothetical protein